MASADRQFKIRIITESDQTGARQSAASLQEIKGGAEKAEISHRALRVALHQLGPEFAEVGHTAMYAFANPITAGVIGLSVAVGLLIKHFKELDEKAEETAKGLDEKLSKMQEGWRKVTEETVKSDDKFAEWYQHLSERTNQIIERLEKIKFNIEHLTGGGVAKGVIEEQAIERSLTQARTGLSAAQEAAIQAHVQATDSGRAQLLEDLPKQIAEQTKKVADAEKAKRGSFFADHFVAGGYAGGMFSMRPRSQEEIALLNQQRQDALNKETARLKEMQDRQTLLTRQRDEDQRAEAEAQHHAQDMASQVRSLEKQVGRPLAGVFSPEAMAHLQGIQGARGAGIPSSSLFNQMIGGEEAVGMGQRMSVSQQSATSFLVNILQKSGASMDTIVKLLRMLQDITVAHDEKIKALQERFRNVANKPT